MKPKFNTEIVKNYIKEKGLTVKQFCKLCNISYYNYLQFMKSNFNIYASKVVKISNVLNVYLKDLISF